MVKILVTGACGFIGSHIATKLLSLGHTVVALDNLSTGYARNVDHIKDNSSFKLVVGDIVDFKTCLDITKDVDVICHQAALGSVPRSMNDPITSHLSNNSGFLNILVAARENGVKRIVYASSSSVYGGDMSTTKREDRRGDLMSVYAVTKRSNELYADVFSKSFDMEIIGLRYFNVFGPRQDPCGAYAAVIPKFVNSLLAKISCVINGTGTASRDFTYVDNVVSANCDAMFTDNRRAFGTTFNVGLGGNVSINDLYKMLRDAIDPSAKAVFGPPRLGDVERSQADTAKIVSVLNFTPVVSFDDGLQRTIDYFKTEFSSP